MRFLQHSIANLLSQHRCKCAAAATTAAAVFPLWPSCQAYTATFVVGEWSGRCLLVVTSAGVAS
eukprot:3472167-Amphidinium_carterae.1